MSRYTSGPLTVVVKPPDLEEWPDEDPWRWELVSVEGDETRPSETSLSDVDWLREEVSNVGVFDLILGGELPSIQKPLRITGRLVTSQCGGYEYPEIEVNFEEDSREEI